MKIFNRKCLIVTLIIFLLPVIFLNLGCKAKSDQNKYKYTVGVSFQNLQNEFVINIQDAMRQEADSLKIKLIEADGQGKAENQISQIENFISQKVDVIILNPFDKNACAPAVDKAVAAGIPVIVVNSVVSNLDKAVSYIGSDDSEAGRIEMKYIADRLAGKGNIVIIHGPNGHSAEVQRTLGIQDVLKSFPNIKVVAEQSANWDRAQAMFLMENWLQSGMKIDAVIAQNDEMALGASKAVEAANKNSNVLIIGIDSIHDALVAVQRGNLCGSVFQNAREQGRIALEYAVKIVNKEPVDHLHYIPFQLVTKENVNNFLHH